MILVINANNNRCRLYTLNKSKNELTFYKEISHPENRLKTSELVSDKPGKFKNMSSHGAYAPPMEAKEIKIDDFFREIAKELNLERNQQPIGEIVLVTPPHLYGLLLQHCNKNVTELMTKVIQKDLMHLSDSDLMAYLKETLKYSA